MKRLGQILFAIAGGILLLMVYGEANKTMKFGFRWESLALLIVFLSAAYFLYTSGSKKK